MSTGAAGSFLGVVRKFVEADLVFDFFQRSSETFSGFTLLSFAEWKFTSRRPRHQICQVNSGNCRGAEKHLGGDRRPAKQRRDFNNAALKPFKPLAALLIAANRAARPLPQHLS